MGQYSVNNISAPGNNLQRPLIGLIGCAVDALYDLGSPFSEDTCQFIQDRKPNFIEEVDQILINNSPVEVLIELSKKICRSYLEHVQEAGSTLPEHITFERATSEYSEVNAALNAYEQSPSVNSGIRLVSTLVVAGAEHWMFNLRTVLHEFYDKKYYGVLEELLDDEIDFHTQFINFFTNDNINNILDFESAPQHLLQALITAEIDMGEEMLRRISHLESLIAQELEIFPLDENTWDELRAKLLESIPYLAEKLERKPHSGSITNDLGNPPKTGQNSL